MADKRIDELEAAASVTTNDLFVLEQAGTAKKLDAQTLENWLLALAQGHGGITGIAKTGTAGTNPVVDTYTITFSDTSTTTFDVTNGVKGDTGDQTYVYIKYSNREPIADSDLTDTPSDWMGICSTTAATAPTAYGDYSWYEIKGAKGDPGNDITITSTSVTYQAWTSGTQYPTGTWLDNPPAVTPGNYLWTRTIVNYSDGGQTVSYSVSRWGMDGSGAVASVNNQLPDQDGNVTLTASDVGALPDSYQPPVTSVNNKTGTVVLGNTDVNAPYGKSVSATLSSAGWYRVLHYAASSANDASGYKGAILHLDVTRGYTNAANEAHGIDLDLVHGKIALIGEKSVSNSRLIDKVRYNTNGADGYVDIHYTGASANPVAVCFCVAADATEQAKFTAESLQAVADSPAGETVVTTHSFSAKTVTDISSEFVLNTSISGIAGGASAIFDASTQTVDVGFYVYASASFGSTYVFTCNNAAHMPKTTKSGNGMIHNKTSGEWFPYAVGINASGQIAQGYTGAADRMYGHIKYEV